MARQDYSRSKSRQGHQRSPERKGGANANKSSSNNGNHSLSTKGNLHMCHGNKLSFIHKTCGGCNVKSSFVGEIFYGILLYIFRNFRGISRL